MKKHLNKILIGVSLLFAAVAIILLVAPGITLKSEYEALTAMGVEKSYSMANITFGHSMEVAEGISVEIFKFSFPNLLTYILIAGGMVSAVLALLGKGGKIVSFVAAGLFLVGGVLYLCAGKLLVLAGEDSGMYTIGIGSILGGVFSILAACSAACTAILPMFLKTNE